MNQTCLIHTPPPHQRRPEREKLPSPINGPGFWSKCIFLQKRRFWLTFRFDITISRDLVPKSDRTIFWASWNLVLTTSPMSTFQHLPIETGSRPAPSHRGALTVTSKPRPKNYDKTLRLKSQLAARDPGPPMASTAWRRATNYRGSPVYFGTLRPPVPFARQWTLRAGSVLDSMGINHLPVWVACSAVLLIPTLHQWAGGTRDTLAGYPRPSGFGQASRNSANKLSEAGEFLNSRFDVCIITSNTFAFFEFGKISCWSVVSECKELLKWSFWI